MSDSASGENVNFGFYVEVDLSRAEDALFMIPGGAEKAARAALKRAQEHLAAQSTKEIQKEYALSRSDLLKYRVVKSRFSYTPGEGVTAMVDFHGAKVPLYRYIGTAPKEPTNLPYTVRIRKNGGYQWVHPGVAPRAHQRTGTAPEEFPHAFVARMKNPISADGINRDHTGIFTRTGRWSFEGGEHEIIEEVQGKAYPQMINNPDVLESLREETVETFESRVDHEIEAILKGWH